VDAEALRALQVGAALRGEYLDEAAPPGLEVRDVVRHMEEVDAAKGREFGEKARKKARMLGKPVPLRDESASWRAVRPDEAVQRAACGFLAGAPTIPLAIFHGSGSGRLRIRASASVIAFNGARPSVTPLIPVG